MHKIKELIIITKFIVNMYHKKLDKYFCTPPESKEDENFKLKREQYRLCFLYLILQYISKNLGFLASVFSWDVQFKITTIFFIHLYLLHKKKLKLLQAFIAILCLIPSLIIHTMEESALLLTLPIMLIGFSLYCQVVTGTLFWGAFSYCINTYFIITVYKPKIFYAFNCKEGDGIYEILNCMIGCSISCAFVVNIVFSFLVRSRMKLLKKVMKQQRSLELANKELALRNSKLETSLKANETFLLSVSHELRNPLNAVLGNIDLALMNESINCAIKGFIQNAKSSGEMLVHLINNLLDFGKLEYSSLETSANPTKTLAFMEKVWSSIKILIQKKGLEGKIYLDKNLPERLCFDNHRLMQIIFNLVGNAAKFTDKGTISIIFSWIKNKDNFSMESHLTPNIFFRHSIFNLKQEKLDIDVKSNDDQNLNINIGTYDDQINLSMEELPTKFKEEFNGKFRNYICTSEFQSLSTVEAKNKYYEFNNNYSSSSNPRSKLISPITNTVEKKGYLKIEVQDSGCGMAKDDIGKIFKKFTQVGLNNEYKKIGSGLGLWITKNLCISMNGDIKAFSDIGKGSTFIIIVECAEYASSNHLNTLPMADISLSLRALVVDDVKINQEINESFLENVELM